MNDDDIMNRMPGELTALTKKALLRTAQFRLGTNLPASQAEWELFLRTNEALVRFAENLLMEVPSDALVVPIPKSEHGTFGGFTLAVPATLVTEVQIHLRNDQKMSGLRRIREMLGLSLYDAREVLNFIDARGA